MSQFTIEGIQSSLRIMDMLLEKYSHDPPQGVVPFKTTQEMAKYFKSFTELLLPKEMIYKELPQKSED